MSAIEPDGSPNEYAFRFEMTGFPSTAPEARIWNCETGGPLAANLRPKGSPRLIAAFKDWGEMTVYRPWERLAGAHNDWARKHPDLAWHPRRDLTFILEDLHGLLTSNALAHASASVA